MRAVLQRVSESTVSVDGEKIGNSHHGWLVLLAVGDEDTEDDVQFLVDKTIHLRAFPDDQGKMNRSILDVGGDALVISNFTLLGDCRKGRRPSFSHAAPPNLADRLYQSYVKGLQNEGLKVGTGKFQANMQVSLVNDGPVTLLLDSKKLF